MTRAHAALTFLSDKEGELRQPTPQDKAFAWYYAALKHGAGSPQAPIHDGEPHAGFYRLKGKNGGASLPAYIAMEAPIDDNGELDGDERLICMIGTVGKVFGTTTTQGAIERDAYSAWTYLAGHPVPYEDFKQAWETGRWPDEAPGPNFTASDSLEGLTDQLTAMLEVMGKMPKVISTQTECDQAANLKDRLMECHKALEAMRKAEKDPHDKAAAAVQAKFLPWLAKARDAVDSLRVAMGPFMTKMAEAAKRAAAEAGGSTAAAALDIRPSAGGMSGKRTSTRSKKVPVIVHYKAAALAVLEEPEVKAAVEKAVARWFREGKTAPGVEVKEETKVI